MSTTKRSASRDRGSVGQKKFQVKAEDLDCFVDALAMYNQTHPLDNVEVTSSTVVDSVLKFKMSYDQITSIAELQSKIKQNISQGEFEIGVYDNRLVATTPYTNWEGKKSSSSWTLLGLFVVFASILMIYIMN